MATREAVATEIRAFEDVVEGIGEAYNCVLDALSNELDEVDREEVEQAKIELAAVLRFLDSR